jgi:hypothetical protein
MKRLLPLLSAAVALVLLPATAQHAAQAGTAGTPALVGAYRCIEVPEVFNPAAGGEAGQPLPNGPGLVFGGTCTVTAT